MTTSKSYNYLDSMTVHDGVNAGTYFYAYDGNGNVVAPVNAADGQIIGQYEHGPFGEGIRCSGAVAKENPFRFSTKYQDEETDLLYYGQRFYNPSLGRWPNRDPIGELGGSNLYGFVGNNAISGLDVLGLYEIDGKTIKVKKCEIVIIYGHQIPDRPWRFEFPESCSAGGAVTCWPRRTNHDIPTDHQIPSITQYDEYVYFYAYEPDKDSNEYLRHGDEGYGNQLLRDARENAHKQAEQICKANCCTKVTIYYLRNASGIPGIDGGIKAQKVPKREVIDCKARK